MVPINGLDVGELCESFIEQNQEETLKPGEVDKDEDLELFQENDQYA